MRRLTSVSTLGTLSVHTVHTHPKFVLFFFSSLSCNAVFFSFFSHGMERQVVDSESATDLVDADVGGISFTDVRFGYGPDREILKGLTFEASWGGGGDGAR